MPPHLVRTRKPRSQLQGPEEQRKVNRNNELDSSSPAGLSQKKTGEPLPVSQRIASALLIQNPATPQQSRVFLVEAFQRPKGDLPFNAETQDTQKQVRLWGGSAKLEKALYKPARSETLCADRASLKLWSKEQSPFPHQKSNGINH